MKTFDSSVNKTNVAAYCHSAAEVVSTYEKKPHLSDRMAVTGVRQV